MSDFDPRVGPTIRQQWEAFYRMYRCVVKGCETEGWGGADLEASLMLGDLFWYDDRLWEWKLVAEYGSIHGWEQRKRCWSYSRWSWKWYDERAKRNPPW